MEKLSVTSRNGSKTEFDAWDVHRALADAFLAINGLDARAGLEFHRALSATQAVKVRRLVDAICESLRCTLRQSISVQELELRVALALVRSFELAALRAFVWRRKQRTFLAEPIVLVDMWAPRSSPMHDTEHGIDGTEREHGDSHR